MDSDFADPNTMNQDQTTATFNTVVGGEDFQEPYIGASPPLLYHQQFIHPTREVQSYNDLTFAPQSANTGTFNSETEMIDTSSTEKKNGFRKFGERFYIKKADRSKAGFVSKQDQSGANSLIEQIQNLSIVSGSNGGAPSKRRQISDDSSVISRKNPLRQSTSEKKNYNLTSLSQNCIVKPLIEEKPFPNAIEATLEIDLTEADSFDQANPYAKIYISQNDVDEDIQCDVCLDFEHEDGDAIIICDLCNAATHQSCYGGEIKDSLPTGNWYCQRCIKLNEDKTLKCTDLKCFLCDEVDGIMKCLDTQSGLWAHMICVNWNPDIYYTDDLRSNVAGVLNEKRFDLHCHYCRKTGKGACIQCDYKCCHRSYHVRCAVRRGMIKEWNEMEEKLEVKDDDKYMPLFCEKHEYIGHREFREGGKAAIQSTFSSKYRQNFIQRFNNNKQPSGQQPSSISENSKQNSKFKYKRWHRWTNNSNKHNPYWDRPRQLIRGSGINLSSHKASAQIKGIISKNSELSNLKKREIKIREVRALKRTMVKVQGVKMPTRSVIKALREKMAQLKGKHNGGGKTLRPGNQTSQQAAKPRVQVQQQQQAQKGSTMYSEEQVQQMLQMMNFFNTMAVMANGGNGFNMQNLPFQQQSQAPAAHQQYSSYPRNNYSSNYNGYNSNNRGGYYNNNYNRYNNYNNNRWNNNNNGYYNRNGGNGGNGYRNNNWNKQMQEVQGLRNNNNQNHQEEEEIENDVEMDNNQQQGNQPPKSIQNSTNNPQPQIQSEKNATTQERNVSPPKPNLPFQQATLQNSALLNDRQFNAMVSNFFGMNPHNARKTAASKPKSTGNSQTAVNAEPKIKRGRPQAKERESFKNLTNQAVNEFKESAANKILDNSFNSSKQQSSFVDLSVKQENPPNQASFLGTPVLSFPPRFQFGNHYN